MTCVITETAVNGGQLVPQPIRALLVGQPSSLPWRGGLRLGSGCWAPAICVSVLPSWVSCLEWCPHGPGMYMQVETRTSSYLHLKRAPGIRSWSLLVGKDFHISPQIKTSILKKDENGTSFPFFATP